MRHLLFLAAVLLPSAMAQPCSTLPRADSKNFEKKLETFLNDFCYQKQGWVHDPSVRTSDGVHPFVKVYYSPSMWYWMTTGAREGDVPEGAMLVKEQYPSASQPLNEWTIMVKDPSGSYDGWYWADLSPKSTTAAAAATTDTGGCPEASFPYFGFGMYCLNCHASAAKGTSTYATTAHVFGKTSFLDFALPRFAASAPEDSIHSRPAGHAKGAPGAVPKRCMVDESFDHVVAQAKHLPVRHFVTSNQCAGCHDATGTLSPTTKDLPRMLWPDALAPAMVNLSPNGEWRYSMMGLSGRDPIFFSQLSSENALHPKLEGHQKDGKEFVQNLCLHCHGVMGQRQYQQDTGKLLTREELQNPDSPYGALARDGVSCAACHHIAPNGLGEPSSFTGNFQLGPANELYGPYDKVATVPMKNVLGAEPKSTIENQIESSKLCGSCHTVVLPVYDASGKQVLHNGKPAEFTEQATYLEWLNSSFGNQNCQSCHMPQAYQGQPLSYKIANIEDNTFPAVDFRAPDADILVTTRNTYHRHTLLGINVFALEMFRQFRTELGLYKVNPMLRDPAHTASGIDTAIASSVDMASRETATVSVSVVGQQATALVADVRVVNLVGHNFPSGVGFRRAFLNFQVLDGGGKVIWESGGTTADGRIVDGKGNVLPTESFATQQQFQPHFWQRNPIQRTDQAQIYEELAVNPEGQITTSFIALDHKVKDNRLLPKGWSTGGPFAEETAAVGVCLNAGTCDVDYTNGSGANTVRYEIPLTQVPGAASVRATLYYQSIPPYYLNMRATQGSGTDTERLVRFAAKLDVNGTAIQNWKLAIASATQRVQ
jgi:hypothetical protein